MTENNNRVTAYAVVQKIIFALNKQSETGNISGTLAVLRRSIGKNYEEASDVWPILIPFMPDEFIGTGNPTYEEKAVYNAMQLYALGQQGSKKIENDKNSRNMGSSLRALRMDNSVSLDRRFRSLITTSSYDEFVHQLQQLYKLGKSKGNLKVNFPKLADDLFWYQTGKGKLIRLSWAKEYFKAKPNDTIIKEITEE